MQRQDDQRLDADACRCALPSVNSAFFQQLQAGARHLGQDAGHDQQADAVADAELVDLFAQPHQEDGAAGHRQHGGHLPAERQVVRHR